MVISSASYAIGNRKIELETSPDAFVPTSTSQMLGKVIHIPENASVADLGCGVGNLAIFAALEGASRVCAVDIMEDACSLARRNIVRNGVADRVDVFCGDLFDPIPGEKFDVIIDDVSGVADEVARISPWFPSMIPTGGIDGTDHVIRMIEQAPDRLNKGGALYLPVSSLSKAPKIFEAAKKAFGNVEEIFKVDFPLCVELADEIDRLHELQREGLIGVSKRGSRHLWTLWIYKAWVTA